MDDSDFSSTKRLADRLQRDIEAKRLTAGERYLTAAEAAQKLGVSTATANRAMQLLANQDVLARKRSRGTFIGPAVTAPPGVAVRTAVVLIRADDSHFMSQEAGVFVEAIRRELGDVNVLVGFIPAREPVAYLKEMFRTLMSAGQLASVVAISCPREVYCYLATLDVPFAIGGSVYADSDVIPSVDADNREAGLLLTKHLLKKGCRRIILLSKMEGLPGEHDFHDGTSQALVEMNLPPTTLLVCAYPVGHQELLAFLRHLMQSTNPPDAFICHGAYMAEQVRLALDELAMDRTKQPEIVYDGPPLATASTNHQVYAATQKGFTQIAQMIAALLGKISRGEPLSEQRVIIPVELYGTPQSHTAARRVRS